MEEMLENLPKDKAGFEECHKYLQSLDTDFSFKNCEHLFSLLEETPEGKERTLLRGYKSELVKEWYSFINYMKKEKLHLADFGREIGQI
jgi:hypothetical protein